MTPAPPPSGASEAASEGATEGAAGSVAPGAPFAMVLRGALLPSAVAGLVCAVAMVAWRGGGAIAGATLGIVVGLGFFASGLGLLSRLVRDRSPVTFMAVAMAIYLAQVLVLLGFLIAFHEADWLDGPAFGLVVLTITIAWQFFLVRAWRHARVLVYDEPPTRHTDILPSGGETDV